MGPTLVDADNGFNNLSRYGMLWTIRHRWPAGARFVFNCYRHFVRCIVRIPGSDPRTLTSREGVIQGCVLGMVCYGIALLPLAERLWQEVPECLQPWYADDFVITGPAWSNARCFNLLKRWGPSVGYFPSAEKSFHICPRRDEARAKAEFEAAGLQVQYTRGHRYVGGFIGSVRMEERWLLPQVKLWEDGVKAIAQIARRYPQTAYAAFVFSLQAEWQYLCRLCPRAGPHLAPVEQAIRGALIPALLNLDSPIDDDLRRLLGQGVKRGGLALRDPGEGATRLYTASREATEPLVASLIGNSPLHHPHHIAKVRAAGRAAREEREEKEAAFMDTLGRQSPRVKKRMGRMAETGAWLTLMPSRFDGTQLTAEEFRDNVALRYGLRPKDLPDRCDGCGEHLSIEHGLSCKKGGLVCIRHDDVRDEWADLAASATTAARVSTEPLIFYGGGINASQRADGDEGRAGDEARGDVAVHGFWTRGRTTILDVSICDTDARAYGNTESKKVLERRARQKVDKYGEACLERRRDFTPLIYSVDGMPGKEARSAERRLASLLASKWGRTYSELVSYVRARLSLAIIRSNTLLLRGERAHKWRRRSPVQDGAGLRAVGSSRWM